MNHHPRHPKERMMTQQDADAGRNLALQITHEIQRNKPTYELYYDDVMCILSNPNCFDRALSPGLTHIDILDYIDSHRVYFELRAKKSNEQPAPRSGSAKAEASARDLYRCILEGTPYPPNAHIFPYAATRISKAVDKTKACFVVIQHKYGFQLYMKWYPKASTKGGFELKINLIGINERMHSWLDTGIWTFKPLGTSRSGSKYFTRVILYWLPACPRQEGPAILDNGPGDSVTHVFDQLEAAYHAGFEPRTPAKGRGVYKARFADGEEIKSGHIIEIPHRDQKECEEFMDVINFQWFGMFGLTIRGVTKDATPDDVAVAVAEDEEDDEDEDEEDDDDEDKDDEDDGDYGGKGKRKATLTSMPRSYLPVRITSSVPSGPPAAPPRSPSSFMPGTRQTRQVRQARQASQAGPSGSGYGTIGRKSGRGGN
ncbi:hypothetical protein NW768_002840 [Fusarium equiseti]|uniref:Uncharacterized protein n=1 Tax=Fusarium equiseti TaxID=61235 RepID=A0ABQ8RK99_FUSEQ|nr:hypothetical protein NW768_002840 [Fusarium equiseti]